MMPPPLHSCSWRTTDAVSSCQLDVCSLPDLRGAKIGMNSTPKGRSNYSGVFNCQALAYRDMNERQVDHFAERTKTIYDEAQIPKHQMAALKQTYLRFCPWMVRSLSSNTVRCLDLDKCDVVKNPSCCMNLNDDSSNMDNICPRDHILCQAQSDETQRCVKINRDDPQGTCGKGTRWKPCPDEEECPFAVNFPALGYIQCNDLSIVSTSQEDKIGQGWCATRQGIRKCPLERPWMCAGKECKGEHCCEKKPEKCVKKGFLRYCPAAYRPQNTSTKLERINLIDIFDAAAASSSESAFDGASE